MQDPAPRERPAEGAPPPGLGAAPVSETGAGRREGSSSSDPSVPPESAARRPAAGPSTPTRLRPKRPGRKRPAASGGGRRSSARLPEGSCVGDSDRTQTCGPNLKSCAASRRGVGPGDADSGRAARHPGGGRHIPPGARDLRPRGIGLGLGFELHLSRELSSRDPPHVGPQFEGIGAGRAGIHPDPFSESRERTMLS